MANLSHGIGALQLTEDAMSSESVELFRPLTEEIALLNSRTLPIQPHAINDSGPLEFTITPQGDSYIDLSATRLYVKIQVYPGADNTELAATDQVAIINLCGNSLFNTIDIDLNGKSIPELTNTNTHIKGYIETLMSYTPNTHHLEATGWAMDEVGAFDSARLTARVAREAVAATGITARAAAPTNSGFLARRELLGIQDGQRRTEFYFPLASDFFNSDRLLLPGVKVTVRLTRTPNNIALIAEAGAPRVNLVAAKLYVTYVDVHEVYRKRHAAKIQNDVALMPMNKCVIKQYPIAAGMAAAPISNIFLGMLPKNLIIGMVEQSAYTGDYHKNPFFFRNMDCNYASLRVNGVLTPAEPYTPDFDHHLYIREFREFYDNIGISHSDLNCHVSKKLYRSGATFFAFDLSPDKCNGYHKHVKTTGAIDLDLRYSKNLPVAIYVIILATFDAYLTIDNNYNTVCSVTA
jgi:hypothetical protein